MSKDASQDIFRRNSHQNPTYEKHNKRFPVKYLRDQLKDFYDRWNFDYILLIILLLTFIVVPGYIGIKGINLKCSEDRKRLLYFAEVMGITIGLLFTGKNLHDQYHYNKRKKASDYVELWYSQGFIKSVETIRMIKTEEFDLHPSIKKNYAALITSKEGLVDNRYFPILRLKDEGIKGKNQLLSTIQSNVLKRLLVKHKESKHVDRIFSLFEQIGEDIRLNVADGNYLKDFFYRVIITYYEIFRKYIEYKQRKLGNKLFFCNFVYLAHSWEKQLIPPELPRICDRKWFLSKEEYEEINFIMRNL